MDYTVNLITKNRSKIPLKPMGAVVHDTDDAGATAANEQHYFNTADTGGICAHAFVDWQQIIQTVPYDELAGHAGPTANSKFLGIELCVPKGNDPDKFKAVWNGAVNLFSDLFINQIGIANITPDNLMGHAEVSAKWHESTHEDPVAFFKGYGKTVDDFRAAVQAAINVKLQPPVQTCVRELVHRGIISDQSLWEYVGQQDANVYALLVKSYRYITINGGSVKGIVKDLQTAFVVMEEQGIISQQQTWVQEIAKMPAVQWLIIKIADYID